MARPAPPSSTLGRLLAAAGYRLEVRHGATVGVRSRDHRAVVIAPSTRPPSELQRLYPSDAVQRTLVYDDDPGPAARASAAALGIEVVDPSTIGPALGEILLPSSAEHLGSADPALDGPFALVREGESIVRPRIGRAQAELLVGVDGPRYTLRLVPHLVAAYRVRSPSADGAGGPLVGGLVAVNATSRRAELWQEGDRELVSDIAEVHQRLVPQVSESLAAPIAVDAIRREHTVRVDHTEQLGGALIVEWRKVPPSTEDVRLSPFVLLYVPHWYVEGSEGRLVLDAVTGQRVVTPELPLP